MDVQQSIHDAVAESATPRTRLTTLMPDLRRHEPITARSPDIAPGRRRHHSARANDEDEVDKISAGDRAMLATPRLRPLSSCLPAHLPRAAPATLAPELAKVPASGSALYLRGQREPR